jgi:hypothetical protein
MRLQLESYGKKYIVETQYDDVTLDEYFDMFKGILVQATFNQKNIEEFIIELADSLKEN